MKTNIAITDLIYGLIIRILSMSCTINTSKGPIQIEIHQKYKLTSLISLTPEKLQPFYDLFHISGDSKLCDLIRLLFDHNLIDGDKDMITHPLFDRWVAKPLREIQCIMQNKGIWFEGMNKYFAIKVLLLSHSIVEEEFPRPVTNPSSLLNLSPFENRDTRKSITTGIHYEPLPDRDFQISTKRQSIRDHMLKRCNSPMLTSFSENDLRQLYQLYDRLCFDKELSSMLKRKNRTIEFGTGIFSGKTAGDHCKNGSVHTIRISSQMIGNLFSNGEKSIKANGLVIYDRLGALIIVFEHELIHLYCSLKGYTRKIIQGEGKMYYSPHGKLFQELVFRYFGHTDFYHHFNHGEASDHLTKGECKIGMSIYFESQKEGKIYGKIVKINPKRCKVNTESGSTYDVPYAMIRMADKTVIVADKPETRDIKSKYSVGMKIRFKHSLQLVSGTIIKCNPKRARVTSSIGVYNIPYELLV